MKTLPPKLASLFEKHHITYTWRGEVGPTWDGHDLDIAGARDNAWVCHELAHCLTASRLDLPNYGLGTDPGGGGESEQVLSDEQCTKEENLALIGGVLLMVALGETVESVENHIEHYGIKFIEKDEVIAAFQQLPPFLRESCSLEQLQTLFQQGH